MYELRYIRRGGYDLKQVQGTIYRNSHFYSTTNRLVIDPRFAETILTR
jgi:hypothetical protein